jgi:hypothetical protein
MCPKWSEGLGSGGNYISTKEGTDVTVEIIAINKVTNKPDYEPKNKKNDRQGFCFEFVAPEGIITVGTFTLQKALRDAGVDVGDTIRIQHPKHGVYIVTKINK